MATTLLEKRLLDYKNKETKNLDLDEISVSYYLGTEKGVEPKTKKLSELFVKEKSGDKVLVRPLKSYNEFVKHAAKGNVFVEKSGIQPLPHDGKVVLAGEEYFNRTEPYYASFEVDKSFETINNVEITKTLDGKISVSESVVPYGLTRTMKVQENELSSYNTYLMMIFEGSSKQEFIKKSEIYYIDGASIVYLYENNKPIDFNKIKGKTLYAGNRIINKIYTEKEYTFGEYQKFEKVDVENLVKNSYELINEPTEADKEKVKTGEVVELDGLYYAKKEDSKQDGFYSTANQVTLIVDDPKKPGKTKTESYYSVKIYEVSNSGDYVSLRIKGGNKVEMIEVSKLCDENGNPIDKSNIRKYVGKSLKIKIDDKTVYETEKLTYEQAVYFYKKHYNYEPSMSKDDILAENAYLQTANGEFVKESYVTPISYKFTDEDNCDAYLIKVETEEGVKEKIVSTQDYSKATKGLSLKGVYKLETSSFADGKVIQTSGTGHIMEECRVLGSYDAEKDIYNDMKPEDEKLVRQVVLNGFKESYLKGQYKLDYVYVDGEQVILDPRHKRYMYTDEHLMKDYAADTLEYSGLAKSNVKYVSKDGKLGKFQGNTNIKFGKICQKAYSIWFKSLVYYIGASITGFGLFACVVAPALVVAAAGAIIAAPVLIPIVAGVTCFVKNVLNRPFKDKTKYNRKKWNKNLEKELSAINENMQETDFSKGYSKEAFLAKINKLKVDILASSKATVGDGFQIVNGEIVVTGENVNQVKEFKTKHKANLNDLKARKSKLEKARKRYEKRYIPFKKMEDQGIVINKKSSQYQKYIKSKQVCDDLQELYDKEESRFNRTMASHKSEALTYNADSKMDDRLKRVDRLQNFWLIKKFTSKEDLLAQGYTEEEIKTLEAIEYDSNKDLFITKNGKFTAENCKPCKSKENESTQDTINLLTKLKNSMSDGSLEKPIDEIKSEEEIKYENKDNVEEVVKVKKPRKVNPDKVLAEDNVIKVLNNKSSTIYKEMCEELTTRKRKKLTKEEAEKFIANIVKVAYSKKAKVDSIIPELNQEEKSAFKKAKDLYYSHLKPTKNRDL